MRLTCPNCDAQYEVPDDVIPQDGRDVQCSNCGNTWFQHPAGAQDPAATGAAGETAETEWAPEVSEDEPLNEAQDSNLPEEEDQAPDAPVSMASDAPDEVLAAAVKAAIQRAQPDLAAAQEELDEDPVEEPEPEQDATEDDAFDAELEAALDDDYEEEEDALSASENSPADDEIADDDQVYFEPDDLPDTPPREPAGKRRTIDPTVANILQEEAALEAERRAEEHGLESQPDLGLDKPAEKPLDDAAKRAKQARDRMARMRGLSPEEADRPAEPIPANSRRDLLPDIDEINSTLRATEDRAPEEQPDGRPTASQRRAGGKRMGFAIALLLIGLLAYAYNSPDVVADTVPGSENYVAAYVNFVDQARIGLDAQLTKVMLWIESMTSEG